MTATAGTAEGKASWGLAATAVLAVLALLVALAAPAAAQENSNGNGNENGEEEPPPEPDAIQARRLAGEDRYATAAEVARDAFEAPVVHAVLARGDAFPDALAGSYLAGHLRAPILLTPPSALAEAASSVLAELQVGTVHLLGGPSAISPAVAAELSEAGYQVRRVSGTDRYATAAEIATVPQPGRVATIGGKRTALLASGVNFPDALSAGPLAYRAGVPLLLTHPDALVPPAEEALTTLGIEQVLVLGGPAAISPAVLTALGQRGISTRRLAGPTRVETAAAVADYLLAELAWDAAGVRLARANEFPDGLSGSPHAGESFAPILLTPTNGLHPGAARWLTRHAGVIEDLAVFGGVAALADGTVAAAEEAAGTPGPNQAYDATAEPASLTMGAARTCTVSTPLDAIVHLRLLPASSAVILDDGRVLFKDAEPPDGQADVDDVSATIRTVGAEEQPSETRIVNDVAVPSGELRVTIASTVLDHVRLVAFSDRRLGTPRSLDLESTMVGAPLEPFGVGCETRWRPDEGAQGRHDGLIVRRVDPDHGAVFAGTQDGPTLTFVIGASDSFEVSESPVTEGQFLDAVSAGDHIDVDYRILGGGASQFSLVFDTVRAPPPPVAEVIDGSVHLRWFPPADNGRGTVFRVARTEIDPAADGPCKGSLKTEESLGRVSGATFVDRNPVNGCAWYEIYAESSEGASRGSTPSTPVEVPVPEADEEGRPCSTAAVVTVDRPPTDRVSEGDILGISFGRLTEDGACEPGESSVVRPHPGASITIRDESGQTTAVTHGADAFFTVDEGGETLTVALFRDPPVVPTLPADIVGQVGIRDQLGAPWDVSASPARRLESTTAPPGDEEGLSEADGEEGD